MSHQYGYQQLGLRIREELDQSGAGMASLVAIFTFLTTLSLVMRFVIRKMQKSAFGLDDLCVIPAWLCFIGIIALLIYGMFHDIVASPMFADSLVLVLPENEKVSWITNLLATIALGFTRLSALFWYRRIFVNRTKSGIFGPVTIFFIVFVCIWTITFIGIDIGVCGKAVSAYPPNPKCFYDWYVIIFALTSFVLDVLVVFLPIPMIWVLHTTIGRKAGITAVFLMAAAGITASGIRLAMSVRIWSNKSVHIPLVNITFSSQILYYLVMEVGLAIVAVNLPSLWYLSKLVKTKGILDTFRSFVGLRSTQSSTAGNLLENSHRPESQPERRDDGIIVTQDYAIDWELHEKAQEKSNV